MKTNFFALALLFFTSMTLSSCGGDDTDEMPGISDTNPPSFQFVKFDNGEVDVTFYDAAITVKQLSGHDNTTMVVRMKLENYPTCELNIEAPQTTDGEYSVHDQRSAGAISISGKGFTSETDEYLIRSQKFPGDENSKSVRFYTKDGKSVLEIDQADFETPGSSLLGRLSINLVWEEK